MLRQTAPLPPLVPLVYACTTDPHLPAPPLDTAYFAEEYILAWEMTLEEMTRTSACLVWFRVESSPWDDLLRNLDVAS